MNCPRRRFKLHWVCDVASSACDSPSSASRCSDSAVHSWLRAPMSRRTYASSRAATRHTSVTGRGRSQRPGSRRRIRRRRNFDSILCRQGLVTAHHLAFNPPGLSTKAGWPPRGCYCPTTRSAYSGQQALQESACGWAFEVIPSSGRRGRSTMGIIAVNLQIRRSRWSLRGALAGDVMAGVPI